MRILGVDPGIATVGFAVLDADKRSQRLLTCGAVSYTHLTLPTTERV